MPANYFIPEELHDDDLNREPVLNLMCNGITRYFQNSKYYESNVFLLNGEFGSGKTWILKKVETKTKKMKVQKWLKYSAYQYFSEKELFFDFYSAIRAQTDFKKVEDKIKYVNGTVEGLIEC